MSSHFQIEHRLAICSLNDINIIANDPLLSKTRQFSIRYRDIENIKRNFLKSHVKIEDKKPKDFNSDAHKEIYDDFMKTYYNIKVIYSELYGSEEYSSPKSHDPSPKSEVCSHNEFSLPKLKLPNFDGQVTKFQSFLSVFNSLVHLNHRLNSIQKMHHLISCLTGDAEGLIKHLPITEENYQIAYDLLLSRYDNKRLIADTHLDNIMNLPIIVTKSNSNLRQFVDILKENIRALEALGMPVCEWSFIILHIILKKMDIELRNSFELQHGNCDIPEFSQLLNFLESRCKALEASKLQYKFNNSNTVKVPKQVFATNLETIQCKCCLEPLHPLYTCDKFLGMSVINRRDFVTLNRFCYNCLRPHLSRFCKSKSTCRECGGFHHTLLHNENLRNSYNTKSAAIIKPCESDNEELPKSQESNEISVLSSTFYDKHTSDKRKVVLLATAVVKIQNQQGRWIEIRALIDPGSEATFITESCVQRLNLSISQDDTLIAGLGGRACNRSQGRVNCVLKSRYEHSPILTTNALILQQLTKNLPSLSVSHDVVKHFAEYQLADPTFHIKGKIDILIGSDIYDSILLDEPVIKSSSPFPGAIKTIFGWVLIGKTVSGSEESSPISNFHVSCECDHEISDSLLKFWESEEPPINNKLISLEDTHCENHFKDTHYRDSTGRFVVRLPFQLDPNALGNSHDSALRRFYAMERKLSRDAELKSMYSEFLREYQELGHMSIVKNPSLFDKVYFIPHHGVIKTSSSTTKLRVVFDASMASDNGRSLNNILYAGPKLQHNISDIILRFRIHEIVFICDIKQMYRQVVIHPDDRKFQHIFWRDHKDKPVQEYALNTVTYGVTSAPFLAMRALHQLALDGAEDFPYASQVLLRDIFVDDIVTGHSDLNLAQELKSQLISLLKLGGFELRKWCSNKGELLEDLPQDHFEVSLNGDSNADFTVKVLGIKWSSSSDTFLYNADMQGKLLTKRALLSNISKIFDPCGWLSPVTFTAKAMMQRLWILHIGWDEVPPEDFINEWREFAEQFSLLQNVSIPRHIYPKGSIDCQLHAFSDASERGYSAVVYLRVVSANKQVQLHLLIAKSKVAPIKKRLTIPRLELNGALLAAKLVRYVKDVITIPFTSTTIWCDSTIVLAWLQKSPHTLRLYEGNRVSQIHELVEPHVWRYVPSSKNPADASCRGLLPQQLVTHHLWWGPQWLKDSCNTWPVQRVIEAIGHSDNEKDISCLTTQTAIVESENLLYRYNSLNKLLRVTALCRRFIHNCKNIKNKIHGPLNSQELIQAQQVWIKYVQEQVFQKELLSLKQDQHCGTSLNRLALFIDPHGLLRVGGRLNNSHLDFSSKHPILLPRSHHLTNLIVDCFHVRYLHVGPNTLHSILRQQFWILSGKQTVRSRTFRCIKCFRCKPRSSESFMGELPEKRVTPSRPFSCVGVDFAGPIQIKSTNLRSAKIQKSYLCIFVCFSTKAVHLEIVSELSTNAFLAALNRFVSRRGICHDIYSDNGTNFRGANSHLKELYTILSKSNYNLISHLTERKINWHFSPAAAPHFNGISESVVKSAKYHLKRVIGQQCLTFEELYTLFCRIEAVLNSRPLCPLSSDPNDLTPLTPGHFLIGTALVSVPEYNHLNDNIGLLSRWQLLQKLAQSFWKQWSQNYLHTLQQRQKWFKCTNNLKLNDLVLIKEDDSPPLQWKLGRIVKLHPGQDGIVRAVTIKTVKGLVQRPTLKVCVLPSQD